MSAPPKDVVVAAVKAHLRGLWPEAILTERRWSKGPAADLGPDFCIVELSPTRASNNLWVYSTAGSDELRPNAEGFEFVLLAPTSDERHVETLTMLAHYHRFESSVGLNHIVPIGDSWAAGSRCDRLLISLPYPYGPGLEWLRTGDLILQFLWALPITPEEAAFANQQGVESLEQRFDEAKLRYWDPLRQSVV